MVSIRGADADAAASDAQADAARRRVRLRHAALRFGAVAFLFISCAAAAHAQSQSLQDLGKLSIAELANIEVTSVEKRPQPLSQAPASVFVITSDDIRRSGATSLPEVLRLAPNLEVARINAYQYAITARGFNSFESSNKILVLIDGRSVYSPLAGTVYWDQLDIPLDEIERIEVVSGPGGTLYGPNAVNGTINIITKNSRDTKGAYADLGTGTNESDGYARYGGKIGRDTTLRVYGTGFDRAHTMRYSKTDHSIDGFYGGQTGFRLDSTPGVNDFTAEGDVYNNTVESNTERLSGGDLNGHWSRRLDNGSTVALRAYYSKDDRWQPTVSYGLDTYDLKAQQNIALGAHQFVWGAEGRLWHEGVFSSGNFYFATPSRTLYLGNIFAQDTIALRSDLKLTGGLKVEDNNYSGLDLLPSIRLGWQATPRTFFWSAVSRAVRTPSQIDRELQGSVPGAVILRPSPDFQSEKLTAFEIGYRGQPTDRISLSASLYYNIYDDLRTDNVVASGSPPVVVLGNGLAGDAYGLETWANYSVLDWWRLGPGIDWLHKNLHLKSGVTDFSQFQSAGQDPAYQLMLRSEMNLPHHIEFDVTLRDIDHVSRSQVPGYIEADVRLGWQATPSTEIEIDGNNLVHAHHLEVYDPGNFQPRYVSRSVMLRVRTKF